MATEVRAAVAADGVRVMLVQNRLWGSRGPLPRTAWGKHVDLVLLRAVQTLVDAGQATDSGTDIFIPSRVAAALPSAIADDLGLPALAELRLIVALEGRVETPGGRLHLRWTDRAAREILPVRTGIVLTWGDRSGRLSAPLHAVVEAAEAYNATLRQSFEERISAWMPMQQALSAVTDREVARDGYLETFMLYQAGAFALDVHEDAHFTPILMSRSRAPSLEDDAPAEEFVASGEGAMERKESPPADGIAESLLPPDDHREFMRAFSANPATRDAYRIGRNRYVLIDPSLKRALDVVRAKSRAGDLERKELLRNPRAAIAEVLRESGDAPSAMLFIETEGYSDRVAGLGLWEPPTIPWMTRKPNAWLPESGWVRDGEPIEPRPLTPDELEVIEEAYRAAEVNGDSHVVIRGQPIPIDAVPSVLAEERARAEAAALEEPASRAGPVDPRAPAGERLVLVIDKTNFEGLDYELSLRPRRALIGAELPAELMGRDAFKPHQDDGFAWLVEAWRCGWPGVLLADDMGLGKTFQALALMAWLRSNTAAARARGVAAAAQGPMLVVGPTALLKNWEKECADRLAAGALGELVSAYGRKLAKLKLGPSQRSDPGETLDRGRLREADWILTTYETLTDHERAFAPIPYALVVFDEMQKVKAPDTLNTKAAKVLNADFVLGLTGTPIENRMEDIWSLFDRLTPGYLGDLKTFSATYREDKPENLAALKRQLDRPIADAPAIMKRRMKADILAGLPEKKERSYESPMPAEQADAYRALVAEATRQRERSPGFMLKALHGMRGISLHPQEPTGVNVSSAARFEAFARRSARLAKTVEILRQIHAKEEKVLVFVEFLAMQDVVAEGVAALFDLPRRPDVINGGIPGDRRLAIVETFQAAEDGFGALILSPRAAGLGLNITAANHVIHLSRWWNPAVEDQCNDRTHRIGQTKTVTIHIPIAIHPDFPRASFDQKLHELLERKRSLSRHMLAPPTSDSDVAELFGGTVPG